MGPGRLKLDDLETHDRPENIPIGTGADIEASVLCHMAASGGSWQCNNGHEVKAYEKLKKPRPRKLAS